MTTFTCRLVGSSAPMYTYIASNTCSWPGVGRYFMISNLHPFEVCSLPLFMKVCGGVMGWRSLSTRETMLKYSYSFEHYLFFLWVFMPILLQLEFVVAAQLLRTFCYSYHTCLRHNSNHVVSALYIWKNVGVCGSISVNECHMLALDS